MATNIPPHNLGEVCTALVKMIDADLEMSPAQLCRYIKGPDFPTGGQIVNSADELKEIYKTGSGTVRIRATWQKGPETRTGQTIYITSIPYTLNKATLVERIADVVALAQAAAPGRRPGSVDRRRADCAGGEEGRRPEDGDGVPVQAHAAAVDVPGQPDVPDSDARTRSSRKPERLDLHEILWHFLDFRFHVVTRRLEYELAALEKRIHILEGFETVFDALDEILRIIRKSDGKQDAAAEDHEAVLARRRADRRDPRAEAVPAGAARDPRHPAGTGREAEAREGDWRAAREQGGPLGDHPRRDRGGAEDLRRPAPHRDRRRGRRGGVHRRRLHRRGRQRRHRHARRVGEAAEGSEGRRVHARARGRRGAGRPAGQHAGERGVLHELRHGVHVEDRRRAGVDRVRRADSEPVQVQGRREGRRGASVSTRAWPASSRRRTRRRRRRRTRWR